MSSATIVERWAWSGTVSFSSTESAPLISAMTSASCSFVSVPDSAGMDRTLATPLAVASAGEAPQR